jgi:phosphate transport system substrate-binding protein
MVILGPRWAEEYMKLNPGTVVQVTGGGSGTGISALINGTTDICAASRPMKSEERKQLKEKYGSSGIEIKTAIDGLSIYVHPSNPVRELTLEQLKEIYTGKTRNWKAVGGPDAPILLYGRENNSGTYAYFKEEVLRGADFAPQCQSLPGTASVVNAVTKDKSGIGYGGVAFGKGVKELKLRADSASKALEPSQENIKRGTYPLSRYLYLYVRNQPTGEMKQYIDWILGAEGQRLVSDVGFVRIK